MLVKVAVCIMQGGSRDMTSKKSMVNGFGLGSMEEIAYGLQKD